MTEVKEKSKVGRKCAVCSSPEVGDSLHIAERLLLGEDRVFVYGLHDPADGIIRYIGKTTQPHARLTNHFTNARRKINEPRQLIAVEAWIGELIRQGRSPVMQILEITDREHGKEVEFAWMCCLHDEYGTPLLNTDRRYCKTKLGAVLPGSGGRRNQGGHNAA